MQKENTIQFIDLDVDNIGNVLRMMADFYALDQYPFDEKQTEENFTKFIQNPDLGKTYLILLDNQIAGYIIVANYFSFEFGGNIWFLDELYIDSRFQGKSLGKNAVLFVKELAQKNQISVVLLEVENHNERAIALYEKSGFEKHKRSLMILKN